MGDAGKPAGPERVESSLFYGVEQTGGAGIIRLMSLVNRGVVEPALKHDAVCDGAQTAVRRGVGLCQQRVRVLDLDERASARGNRAGVSVIRRP